MSLTKMAELSMSIADLTCCAICLESFTRPKVLPCQHTYCYCCLLSLCPNEKQTQITCPQCREKHRIPKGGVSNFKDNITVNNLLKINVPKAKPCSDCELKPSVSECEHCNTEICASCLVEHIKLSMELKTCLNDVKENMTLPKSDGKREKLEASKEEWSKQMNALKESRKRKLRSFATFYQNSSSLENFMRFIGRVYDDFTVGKEEIEETSYCASLSQKIDKCMTIRSLKELKSNVSDLRTVVRLLQRTDDDFRFVPAQEGDVFGHIEIGQAIITIRGRYESEITVEELFEVFPGLQQKFEKDVMHSAVSCHRCSTSYHTTAVEAENELPVEAARNIKTENVEETQEETCNFDAERVAEHSAKNELNDQFHEVCMASSIKESVFEPTIQVPVFEPTFYEPASEPTIQEPVFEPTFHEPASEPTIQEPVFEPTFHGTASEPTIQEPVFEPTFHGTAFVPTIQEPVFEPTFHEPASEPTTQKPVFRPTTNELVFEPALAVADPVSTIKIPLKRESSLVLPPQCRVVSPPPALEYYQNQLPTNVNYNDKGKGEIPVIGRGKKSKTTKLRNPQGIAYHVERREIFVADSDNDRILAYPMDGGKGKVFYEVTTPNDVAISSDGLYVYIAVNVGFIKVTIDGKCDKTITSCSLGPFKDCCSIACYKDFTILVSGAESFRCIFIYDKDDREIRHFGAKYLKDPTGIGISQDGTMYITDDGDRCIRVFKWNGQYLHDFLDRKENRTFGEAAVDGDDHVCVATRRTVVVHTIDVYDKNQQRLAKISRLGDLSNNMREFWRMELTPDGRIIVADQGNHCLQIF